MNRMKILIVGFVGLLAASLCSASQASPPAVPAEKVIALDAQQADVQFNVALCDVEALMLRCESIEREAVSYDVRQPSTTGRIAEHAKVSAHGRTCVSSYSSLRSTPSTKYELRM